METTVGRITGYNDRGEIQIVTAFPIEKVKREGIKSVECVFRDGREITPDQRKKIYAMLRDISIYMGELDVEYIKNYFKGIYVGMGGEDFSLRTCDMTTANEFLELLVDFCLSRDIPLSEPGLDRAPDVSRYLYRCLMTKKCCICGTKAELHHWQAVGRRNRKDICHMGMEVCALCRIHHTEFHNIGVKDFAAKYHVYGIKADLYICGVWKLRKEAKHNGGAVNMDKD